MLGRLGMLKTPWDERREREGIIVDRVSLVFIMLLLAVAIINRCCEV
jgi:hypothetical protein